MPRLSAELSYHMRRLALLILSLTATVALALGGGCTVHKLDLEQGNIVTQEAADALRPGLTKEQVLYLLGTPLITDPFRDDRWDYVYRIAHGQGGSEQYRLTLYFVEDILERVERQGAIESPPSGDGAIHAPDEGMNQSLVESTPPESGP